MKLEPGQVAVITGGASGIGLALARALARRDLQVCLLDVEQSALRAAVVQLAGEGLIVEPFVCDVSDAAEVQSIADAVLTRHGRVDLLVNNAGVGGLLSPQWATPSEDWAWVLGVNLMGVVNGVRAFVPCMLARGSGHVLNMASLAGLTAPPFMGPYLASKHAVVALTESLAVEFATVGSSLKASVACPGNVESHILAAARNRPGTLQATSSAPPEMLARLSQVFEGLRTQGLISGDEAAALILAGVEQEALHILTHPSEHGAAGDRLALLGAALAEAA